MAEKKIQFVFKGRYHFKKLRARSSADRVPGFALSYDRAPRRMTGADQGVMYNYKRSYGETDITPVFGTGVGGSNPPGSTMTYVYFLFLKNGKIYTGSTDDLRQRVEDHKKGRVVSTRSRQPQLIGYEAYQEKSDALRRERFLKTTEGKRLFRMQYRDILKKYRDKSL